MLVVPERYTIELYFRSHSIGITVVSLDDAPGYQLQRLQEDGGVQQSWTIDSLNTMCATASRADVPPGVGVSCRMPCFSMHTCVRACNLCCSWSAVLVFIIGVLMLK